MTIQNSTFGGKVRARAVMLVALAVWLAGLKAHTGEPSPSDSGTITYTKVLKGSTPEYLSLTVHGNGEALYDGRKLDEPPAPRPLKLTESTTRRIFELAAGLSYFQSVDLESHKKVANLGRKTFLYERGGIKHQAEFNYSTRRDVQELTNIFERIASVAQHIATLEYSIKYDHLSLPRQLRQIQIDLENRALADPELMAPTLEIIIRDPRFLHLAQTRAQNILQRLQNSCR